MTRARLCRFVGMTWNESAQLSWREWETLVELMNATDRKRRLDDGT